MNDSPTCYHNNSKRLKSLNSWESTNEAKYNVYYTIVLLLVLILSGLETAILESMQIQEDINLVGSKKEYI